MGNNYTCLDNISSPPAALGPGSALVPSSSGLLLPPAGGWVGSGVCDAEPRLAPPARQAGEAELTGDVWEEAEEERKIRHIY